MKKLLLLLVYSIFLIGKNFSQTTTCDTLVLIDGTTKLVILGKSTRDELIFQSCGESETQFALPRSKVQTVKKGKIYEPKPADSEINLTKPEIELVEKPVKSSPTVVSKNFKSTGKTYPLDQYKVWLKPNGVSSPIKGEVVYVSDTSLIFAANDLNKGYKFPAETIEYIQLRKQRKRGRGYFLGSSLGVFSVRLWVQPPRLTMVV